MATNYKQLILMRDDLKLPKGKLAVQVAHASVEAVLTSKKEIVDAWRKEGMPKIVLKVKDEKELQECVQRAQKERIITAIITDAGRTVVAPGTVTCLGVGPADEKQLDALFGTIKLL